jgi:hypothetical protein
MYQYILWQGDRNFQETPKEQWFDRFHMQGFWQVCTTMVAAACMFVEGMPRTKRTKARW